MSVITDEVFNPVSLAVSRRLRASALAAFSSGVTAPLPVLMSITSASRPEASFFDRIEEVINGTDSTVAVTSRTA